MILVYQIQTLKKRLHNFAERLAMSNRQAQMMQNYDELQRRYEWSDAGSQGSDVLRSRLSERDRTIKDQFHEILQVREALKRSELQNRRNLEARSAVGSAAPSASRPPRVPTTPEVHNIGTPPCSSTPPTR